MGGAVETKTLPHSEWGEGFFEAVDWFAAANEASGRYTMVTLGACYGAQAVATYRALQRVNALPAKLVAVEADPENFTWMTKHFTDNGIDPSQHWLLNAALHGSNDVVLFPIGSPGSARVTAVPPMLVLAGAIRRANSADPSLRERVRELLLRGETGIAVNMAPGWDFPALCQNGQRLDICRRLIPFELIDLLESDIQGSEAWIISARNGADQG